MTMALTTTEIFCGNSLKFRYVAMTMRFAGRPPVVARPWRSLLPPPGPGPSPVGRMRAGLCGITLQSAKTG